MSASPISSTPVRSRSSSPTFTLAPTPTQSAVLSQRAVSWSNGAGRTVALPRSEQPLPPPPFGTSTPHLPESSPSALTHVLAEPPQPLQCASTLQTPSSATPQISEQVPLGVQASPPGQGEVSEHSEHLWPWHAWAGASGPPQAWQSPSTVAARRTLRRALALLAEVRRLALGHVRRRARDAGRARRVADQVQRIARGAVGVRRAGDGRRPVAVGRALQALRDAVAPARALLALGAPRGGVRAARDAALLVLVAVDATAVAGAALRVGAAVVEEADPVLGAGARPRSRWTRRPPSPRCPRARPCCRPRRNAANDASRGTRAPRGPAGAGSRAWSAWRPSGVSSRSCLHVRTDLANPEVAPLTEANSMRFGGFAEFDANRQPPVVASRVDREWLGSRWIHLPGHGRP